MPNRTIEYTIDWTKTHDPWCKPGQYVRGTSEEGRPFAGELLNPPRSLGKRRWLLEIKPDAGGLPAEIVVDQEVHDHTEVGHIRNAAERRGDGFES